MDQLTGGILSDWVGLHGRFPLVGPELEKTEIREAISYKSSPGDVGPVGIEVIVYLLDYY